MKSWKLTIFWSLLLLLLYLSSSRPALGQVADGPEVDSTADAAETADSALVEEDESLPIAPPDTDAPVDVVGAGQVVTNIEVRGNAKVESDAIETLLETRRGSALDTDAVQRDIRALYDLGYFSDVRFMKRNSGGGIEIIVEVKEKPAIVEINLKGQDEITEEDIREKLETRLYTIVNEATITSDVRMIEKQYADKGFYLATVTYDLEQRGPTEVALTFVIEEGGKVQVGDVHVLGNEFFTDVDIIDGPPGMASRPFTRGSAFGSTSVYQNALVNRDLDYLSFIYRDRGFAEVKVAKPFQFLDADREFVRLTFQVEEGLQYNVGSIDVTGDLLFPKEELIEKMQLKAGELFRYSRFTRDIEMLVDEYGDLGYAYADPNPITKFDREKRVVHINYEMTKGEKVYFGRMDVTGNTKTRDNVIRREFEVKDGELYSGTRLSRSKNSVSRLGYFEEVQVIKQRDEKDPTLLHLNYRVKEKPTGQLQAAIGYTPSTSGTVGSQLFGTGRYDEKNQSGKGWTTNFSARWNGENNYTLDLGFSDPRVNDSIWSAGVNAFFRNESRRHLDDVVVEEQRVGGSVFVGRKIWELIRGQAKYRLQNISRRSDSFLLDRYREEGLSSSMIFSIFRNDVDNFIEPTKGTELTLRQTFTGGILQGDQQYMESLAQGTVYVPWDYTETFRTYFKLRTTLAHIYPMGDEPVPFTERYRMGGFDDLRGWKYWEIGPRFSVLRDPGGTRSSINKGGDKKALMQLEYFVPLIPEAGIKALVFTDWGRVFDDDESLGFTGWERDVGFGFRWITPLAPFRFEWAYPIEDGKLGDMEIIFYIGY